MMECQQDKELNTKMEECNYISKELNSIEISGIRKFYNKASSVPGALSLTLGQPDFTVPKGIKSAMIQAIENNLTTYTPNAGIPQLREEISRYLEKDGIHYKKEEICITVGGSEGLMSVFSTLLNKGDKVLIPDIAYPAYDSCVKLRGGKVINYFLNKNDFSINIEKLEEIINEEKPKILVLSFPSNPTGWILTREQREDIRKILKNKDIFIVSDEIYSALCYEDDYYSICQCEELKNRTILINGFSKIYSMTGLRVGYVCAEESIISNVIKFHQYNVSCAPSISQYGALYGLKHCQEDVEYMKMEFMKRRDYIYKRLIDIGMDVMMPKGAFYIFPCIEKYKMSSEEFCDRLLDEGKVAVVPGSAFGAAGETHIRISYSYSMEEISSAMDRMEQWINKAVK